MTDPCVEAVVRDAYLEGWQIGHARGRGQGPSNTPMQDWADSNAKLRCDDAAMHSSRPEVTEDDPMSELFKILDEEKANPERRLDWEK